jgi:hypothetical protein
MEGSSTANDYFTGNQSEFKNNIIAVFTNPYNVDSSAARALTTGHPGNPMSSGDKNAMIAEAKEKIKAKAESEGNLTLASREDVQLTDPFNLNAPNFLPKAGSPALTGASFAGMNSFFKTDVSYRGAFGSTNWTEGWASFSPKTNSY